MNSLCRPLTGSHSARYRSDNESRCQNGGDDQDGAHGLFQACGHERIAAFLCDEFTGPDHLSYDDGAQLVRFNPPRRQASVLADPGDYLGAAAGFGSEVGAHVSGRVLRRVSRRVWPTARGPPRSISAESGSRGRRGGPPAKALLCPSARR